MEKPIAVGDLVMVVRWPCCAKVIGDVGVVLGFMHSDRACVHCSSKIEPRYFAEIQFDTLGRVPIEWLNRIDPPETGEYERADTRIKHPQTA